MRYIFMDEAGTSAKEPVTVVVGIIANADEHVMSAEALALETLGAVPKNFQNEFVFHATQVYGDPKYQVGWSLTDRLNLLNSMMGIPRKIGMAISLGVTWRNSPDDKGRETLGLSKEQLDHIIAFTLCVGISDRNIRKYAGPREVATIVAEDVPEMRKFLKIAPHFLRDCPMNIPQQHMRQTISDSEAGHIQQSGDIRVTRIRNSVHFVNKKEDPLVQVADACAYGFRRFFAGEKFGVDFVRSILGSEDALRNFASPSGAECYWPKTDIK